MAAKMTACGATDGYGLTSLRVTLMVGWRHVACPVLRIAKTYWGILAHGAMGDVWVFARARAVLEES